MNEPVPKPRAKRVPCRCKGACTKWRRIIARQPYKKKQILKQKARLEAVLRAKQLAVRNKVVRIKCTTRTVEWPSAEAKGEERNKLLFMVALGLTPTVPKTEEEKWSRKVLPVVALGKMNDAQLADAKAATESRLKEIRRRKRLAIRQKRAQFLRNRNKRRMDSPQVVNLISSEEDDSKTVTLSSDEDKSYQPQHRLRVPRVSSPGVSRSVFHGVHTGISSVMLGMRISRKPVFIPSKPMVRSVQDYQRPRPAILSLLDKRRACQGKNLVQFVPKPVPIRPVPKLVPISALENKPRLELYACKNECNLGHHETNGFRPRPSSASKHQVASFSSLSKSPEFILPETIITIDDDDDDE